MPSAVRAFMGHGPGAPAPASAYPKPGYAIYVLAIFFVVAILSYTDRLILNLLVDPIRHDLGITDTQVSLLQGAAFAVLYSVIGLPLGRFADRFNRRNLIVFGVVVWSVATAACGLASGFWPLFAARIGVGLGEAALAPAAMSMIADYFPPNRRGTAIGIFLTGMAMGGGTAVLFGGALLQGFESGRLALPALFGHLPPWRAVLVSLSLPGCLVAPLLLTVREPARRETLVAAAGGQGAFAPTRRFFSENRWTFIYLFTAFALANLVSNASDSWLPSVLIRRFSLSPVQVGASIGAVSLICGGAGTLVGGVIADRLQHAGRSDAGLRFTLITFLCALPLLIFPLMPTVVLALTMAGLYAFIIGMAGTAGLTATQNAVPGEMRGFAVSLQACMYTLIGLGLGPTLVAFTTDHIYRDPKQVGASIVTVTVPVSIVSALLLWRALGRYRTTRARFADVETDTDVSLGAAALAVSSPKV
jgi:MFS family permease